eukprot:466455-Pleurochrysis_carterae.AAC.1
MEGGMRNGRQERGGGGESMRHGEQGGSRGKSDRMGGRVGGKQDMEEPGRERRRSMGGSGGGRTKGEKEREQVHGGERESGKRNDSVLPTYILDNTLRVLPSCCTYLAVLCRRLKCATYPPVLWSADAANRAAHDVARLDADWFPK